MVDPGNLCVHCEHPRLKIAGRASRCTCKDPGVVYITIEGGKAKAYLGFTPETFFDAQDRNDDDTWTHLYNLTTDNIQQLPTYFFIVDMGLLHLSFSSTRRLAVLQVMGKYPNEDFMIFSIPDVVVAKPSKKGTYRSGPGLLNKLHLVDP